MRVTIAFLIFFIFQSELALSQVEQPERFEVEVTVFDNYFDVINGEEDGLLLLRQSNDRNREGDPKYEFILLDSSLNTIWKKDMYIDRFYEYRGFDYFQGAYYLLYKYQKGSSKDLKIIKMDMEGDTTHYTVSNLIPIELSEFEMTQDAALIGGYFNFNPFVIHYSLIDGKSKVLPGIYQNRSELIQLKVDDVSGTFLVINSEKTYDKRNTLSVKTYDFNGEILSNAILEPDEDKGLITGSAADFNRNSILIGGTYAGKRSNFSSGLFVASLDFDGDQQIKYYNYADLKNFFSYLRAKRQKRITDKIERKKIKGKKIKFNYRLLVHEIIEDGDQYIMVGEAYYPKYSNTSSYANTYLSNSYGYPNNYGMYFIGYRYTHAIVIGFDKEGNILWDNSFEIDDVLSYNLDQYVHADTRDGSIVLLYLYDNEIRTKIIQGSDVLEGKSFDEIKLSFEDDIVRDKESDIEKLDHWFGNNYYAYGEQNIKNMKDTGVKLNRRVFYINKVRYK